MIPKKTVMLATNDMFPFLVLFPAIIILKSAVIRMVIGINNSTKTAFTATTLKTESNKESVCPSVKKETKIRIFFQSFET